MPNETTAGFWSYAHADDKLDGGAILELARLIKEEYNLLSGEPLELFVDRDSIAWGEEWRERINSSLAQTTFFIPIITPRYFVRPECRRELLEFAGKAKSLGVSELLLPILYVETRELSPESLDEVVALVAKTQYVNWHDTRLLEPASRSYRAAVNAVARRLIEIATKVTELQLKRELTEPLQDGEEGGVAEVVSKISEILPDWLDAVMTDKTVGAQLQATMAQSMMQIDKLQRSNAPASAVLAAQIRMAREMLPIAERAQKDARAYLSRSTQLDPAVSALVRLVKEHPDTFQLAMPVREAIDEAMAEIKMSDRRNEIAGKDSQYKAVDVIFAEMRHLGRIFQKCHSILINRQETATEGNDIVRRWDMQLQESELLLLDHVFLQSSHEEAGANAGCLGQARMPGRRRIPTQDIVPGRQGDEAGKAVRSGLWSISVPLSLSVL